MTAELDVSSVISLLSRLLGSKWVYLYAALLTGPVVYSLHYVMQLLDSIHRFQCRRHQLKWAFKTVPHVRSKLALPPTRDQQNWHLLVDEGRQRWVFDPNGAPHTFVEKYHLGLTPTQKQSPRQDPEESLRDGADFLMKLQHPTGHWPNDYSGPMFLLPGAIFVKFLVAKGDHRKMFKYPQQRPEFIRYLINMQNEDGGFGVHTESHSTMFGTVLNYVTLRLLGVEAADTNAIRARTWILSRGGAESIPSWGKVWLCVLGLYEYDGINSVPPELALLPDWFPLSQGKIWCHSRIVTTPFSWLYGKRWKPTAHPLLEELKGELYSVPYDKIKWSNQRSNVFEADIYTPHSMFYTVANKLLLLYEKVHLKSLRAKALDRAWDHIQYDDESTNYICLGPVNKCLDMLITWIVEGEESESFQKHSERLEDYFYIGPDGLRMSGYNGSQLWDTSFAVQAVVAGGLEDDYAKEIGAAHHYIDVAQVREDPPCPEEYYRHRTKGAWNFSTRAQSWQVSDCTAEGLRVVLLLRNKPNVLCHDGVFDESRIFDAVDEILSLRNSDGDGGWASYEPSRGPKWLELLNCAEVYKDIMIDYSYAECSSSCIHTLCLFKQQFPQYKVAEINRAISEGVKCVKSKQRSDGSFYGSWAVCFTYAGWLVSEALSLAGVDETSDVFQKLCHFTISKQNSDGGWGEDFNSCVRQVYVENPDGSQVINTAWAVMTLMAAGGALHHKEVERGIKFIMSRQLADGDWAQERISGVFNGNAAIHYPGYKNSMPVWALGKYREWKATFASFMGMHIKAH